MSTSNDERWTQLLSWLETFGMKTDSPHLLVTRKLFPGSGYGLAVTEDIKCNTPLFTIPRRALLNKNTLIELYRQPNHPFHKQRRALEKLTAHQLITLHLATFRSSGIISSRCERFGPFIASMPVSFNEHPLVGFSKQHEEGIEGILCNNLPPRIQKALNQVHERFTADLRALRNFHEDLTTNDLLWAWLNVNTRCMYYQCAPEKTHPDNITLCPILDFANHSNSVPDFQSEFYRSKGCPIPTLLCTSKETLKSGEQVFIRYGGHSACTTFVEYGFVDKDVVGEVALDDLMEEMFMKDEDSTKKKECLEGSGYWGDWTLHSRPSPQPSYRTVIALRLLHIDISDSNARRVFDQVLAGIRDEVSAENEAAVNSTLIELCHRIIQRANDGVIRLKEERRGSRHQHRKLEVGMIDALWEEERIVAQLYLDYSNEK